MNPNRMSRTAVRVISFLTFTCVILGVATAVNAYKAQVYSTALELSHQRAITELCDCLDEIEVALTKSCYTGSAESLSELSAQMSGAASGAKLCLAELDCADTQTDGIFTFLSQVGAYTRAISTGEYNVEANAHKLRMLRDYAASLSDGVSDICNGYFDGTVSFTTAMNELQHGQDESPVLFGDSMSEAQQALTDYPTLIYDGPFSQSQLQKTAYAVEGLKEITKVEARKTAAQLFGANVREVTDDGVQEGALTLYCFTVGDNRVGITKLGGKVCYILSSAYAGEVTISADSARERAAQYLEKLGYGGMKESYYSVYDGMCTVNFAYESNGVTVYGDLIKVSISMDTGAAVSFDASGYLANHRERKIEPTKISEEQARAVLNPMLSVQSVKKALIPKHGKELLCYEFLCRDSDGNDALVYVNALTGKEEQVLLLLYTDGGVLTK